MSKNFLPLKEGGIAAFTLAETLIALAIVGVVAAIVLPQVMTNVNEMSWAKAKDNFEVKIDQATRQMNVNGDLPSYPPYISNATETFTNNFQKYIKIAKRCTSSNLDDCFVSSFKSSGGTDVTTSSLTTGASLGHTSWTDQNAGLSLADGTNMILSFNRACSYIDWVNNEGSIYGEGGNTNKSFIPGNTTACVAIVYDINGNQKPNTVGKDIGELNAILSGDDCIQVGSMCVSRSNVSYSPINTSVDSTWDSNCTSSSDARCTQNRWAGAKKACADLGWHLPSKAELTAIYNISKKNSSITSLLGGMTISSYWSSTEHNWLRANKIYFFPSGNFDIDYKNASDGYVRCIK
ncbi:MAG: hypothetical protein PHC64_00920 [Candidatus Gastranaerophilales bacterium]|nr:hypothetical protein [Candidatus Gastranaerophilales bacterium]